MAARDLGFGDAHDELFRSLVLDGSDTVSLAEVIRSAREESASARHRSFVKALARKSMQLAMEASKDTGPEDDGEERDPTSTWLLTGDEDGWGKQLGSFLAASGVSAATLFRRWDTQKEFKLGRKQFRRGLAGDCRAHPSPLVSHSSVAHCA